MSEAVLFPGDDIVLTSWVGLGVFRRQKEQVIRILAIEDGYVRVFMTDGMMETRPLPALRREVVSPLSETAAWVRGWLRQRRLRRLSLRELHKRGLTLYVNYDNTVTVVPLPLGALPDGGYPKPSASTSTKERGTQRQATATGAGFNSSFRPGALSAVSLDPTLPARVNSYTVPGVFTVETATAGVSGEPQGRVV